MVTIHEIEHPRPEDSSPIYDDSCTEWYAIAVKGRARCGAAPVHHYQTIDDQQVPLTKNPASVFGRQ
jgi:hypothetical protein